MIEFTKRKFLAFPLEQQHKKCAELLRKLYSSQLNLRNFDKKAAQNFSSGASEHCLWQGASEDKNFDAETTSSKPSDSTAMSIYEAHLSDQPVERFVNHYQELQEWMDGVYSGPHQTLNFDSARQSPIEALRSERGGPSLNGKGDEEDRLDKVAASQNSKFDEGRSIGLPDSSLKTIADRYHHHLKLAKRNLKEHNLLPCIRQGDKEIGAPNRPIAIYLDHVRSAHNVGSMIRTTEAFSLGTLYFSEDTPFIDCKQVRDAAMGAEQWVNCKQIGALITLEDLPRPIIAMETGTEATSIFDFIFPETFTLVMGNEEYGCSEVLLRQADYIIEIPLRGRKNSLNVANAFAIAAGEIERQQGKL